MSRSLERLESVQTRYGFYQQIGKGTYADAWLVTPLDQIDKGTRYVMKRINLQKVTHKIRDAMEQEVRLLSRLKHPNIVKYIESFVSRDSLLNIVMSWCDGGDLHSKIEEKRLENRLFEEIKVMEWCIQICLALAYIHEQNIMHRDLKPQNIFLTKYEIIKIGDFGVSKILQNANDMATTIIGTPYYMSPEIFSNKPYDQKADIWAFGCCMYEIVTFELPFTAEDINSLAVQIIGEVAPKIQENYNYQLKKLIEYMLSKNPDDRPTAAEILRDKYVQEHIVRMVEQCKEKVQHIAERKERRKSKNLTVPLASECIVQSSTNNFNTKSSTESLSEARKRRRQKNTTALLSTSDTIDKSMNASTMNDNSFSSSIDESEVWERCPIEKLEYYFEKFEIEDKEDSHHLQTKSECAGPSTSAPATLATSINPESTTVTGHQSIIVETVEVSNKDGDQKNSRYSDIGDLPDQELLPIQGHTIEPLRPLEDAMQSVRHLVASLDSLVRTAKTNAQKRHGILTVDEAAAIQLYTMEVHPRERSPYFILNKTLRSVNRRELIPWFPYLKLILTALGKLPSFEGGVWRGIKGTDLSDQYKENECYTWWNFSSCTRSLSVIEKADFLGNTGLRTLFNVKCLNGKEIKDYSYVQKEDEILLLPGTYFKVTGKLYQPPDLHIIDVQEIKPPYELISPPYGNK